MSIPPLVCSTPPPPDQCEDDKEPEDFDLRYDSSQEDDDNYDFGSFSTYSQYQSSQNRPDPVITNTQPTEQPKSADKEPIDRVSDNFETDDHSESKLKCDEDTALEDLNLTVEQLPLEMLDLVGDESIKEKKEKDNSKNVDFETETHISTALNIPISSNDSSKQDEEYVTEPPSLVEVENPPLFTDEIISGVTDVDIDMDPPEILPESVENLSEKVDPEIPEHHEIIDDESIKPAEIVVDDDIPPVESEIPPVEDDDFGDFDNFQFTSSLDNPTIIDSCDNPWESNATDDDFGAFKANFEDDGNSLFKTTPEHSTEMHTEEISKTEVATEDDDFGDFNDFQSSTAEPQPTTAIATTISDEELAMSQLPVLDLSLGEEELMETIQNVIYSIFEEDISEAEESFDDLESVLGETWGHMLRIDEREPYMVQWNNSLGQQTLLKALCIDSRNILFGPKWSYNTPKYAANLGMAPLQPQKQIMSPISLSTEAMSQEKFAMKSSSSWTDPFTSDGKESCPPETSSKEPTIQIRPTDLDVFEASTSSKPDKIYSSTLNIQPMRQISLPDTHIFTPTDSETPRSTTIHYDNSPTVLMPQPVLETQSDKSEPQPGPSSAGDDDYWEFQDFKGAPSALSPNTPAPNIAPEKMEAPTPSNTQGVQLLQPVKVEPTIPTLNWPDPGEVKETFDDFADFISNSTITCNLQKQETPTVPMARGSKPELERQPPSSSVLPSNVASSSNTDFDDDFDTFKSALPTTSSADVTATSLSGVSNNTSKPATPQVASQPMADFDFAFPKVENVKSESISFHNTAKPKDNNLQNTIPFSTSVLESKKTAQAPNAILSPSLLQPIPASSSFSLQNQQQKSGQILQPLSLESFSQINWPNPGIDLQDLSRFNPVETLHSLKSDLSVNSQSKGSSPAHSVRGASAASAAPDDEWGEFVSSAPPPPASAPRPSRLPAFADDDEWTDFVSSPSVKPQNGLNTISLNVHTNTSSQKSNPGKYPKNKQVSLDIPALNYITPKTNSKKTYTDRHFQNL